MKKILAVGAHLDDIEISCGGFLAKAVEKGDSVKCLVMSRSGYKNVFGKEIRSDEQAVGEGEKAFDILGIKNHEILDFPSKEIEYHYQIIEEIEKRVLEFDPDIILTHHVFDTHQSHVGVGKSTITASRRKNNIYMFEPVFPSGRSYVPFKAQAYVDITETMWKKVQALKEHRTEIEKFGESWVEGIISRHQYRGFEMGVQYAECFEVLRTDLNIWS
jgi:LmbE family N-acetylglucosaminyl deacetylase